MFWQTTTTITTTSTIVHDPLLTLSYLSLALLGAGESGKSTILKQMRLIHAAGFSAAERESFRIVVFSNVMQSMQTILEAMEYLRIPLSENINMVGCV